MPVIYMDTPDCSLFLNLVTYSDEVTWCKLLCIDMHFLSSAMWQVSLVMSRYRYILYKLYELFSLRVLCRTLLIE